MTNPNRIDHESSGTNGTPLQNCSRRDSAASKPMKTVRVRPNACGHRVFA